jgi:hypothetical protein
MAKHSEIRPDTPIRPRQVGGPFVITPVWLLEKCRDARAIQLYAVIAKYTNRDGRAWPTREQLAADAGTSLPSLTRTLKVLRSVGALRTVRRHRASDGAVVGLDYLLAVADPAVDGQKLTGEQKARPGQKLSGEQKADAGQKLTGEQKADAGQKLTGEQKADRHKVTGDRSFESPVISAYKEELDPTNQIQVRKDLSTAAPPTGEQPAAEPPEKPTLLEHYRALFGRRFEGLDPVINNGKDGQLLKRLVDAQGEATVRQLLEWFFRVRDPFINNTGYTLGVFYACFNKLLITYRPPEPDFADERNKLLAEIRQRSDERGKQLEAAARAAIIKLSRPALLALRKIAEDECTRDYPGIATWMQPEAYERALKAAAVRHVVELCRNGKNVEEVVAQFERSHAA